MARVVDGDSLECEDSRRVRLLLIDAPELDQGRFGEIARLELERLAPVGTGLLLELDEEPKDQFGRTLAYARLPDGRMANEELLRVGAVVTIVYPPNVRHVSRFRDVATDARAQRRGLWAEDAFSCLPVDFRRGNCSSR